MAWWNPFKPKPKPAPTPPPTAKEMVDVVKESSDKVKSNPNVEVGYLYTPSPSRGSSGGGRGSSSGGGGSTPQVQGPVPQEADEQTFRETGVTTAKPTASTSVTQVRAGDSAKIQAGSTSYEQVKQDKTALEKIGISRGDKAPTPEVGAFIVTPEEAMGMRASRQPYVTTEGISFNDSVGFGSSIGGVSLYGKTPVFSYTKKAYEVNTELLEGTKQVYLAETDLVKQFKSDPTSFKGTAGYTETPEGYSISGETFKAKIDYDSILGGAKDTARTRYLELDKGTRRQLIGSEVGVGVSKVVVGLPLAGANVVLGGMTATFTEESLGRNFSWKTVAFGDGSRSIRFAPDTFLGRIQDAPTGWIGKTAQYGTTAGLVVVGVGLNTAKVGSFKEGLMETASYGGMYKIKSGTFTPSINANDKTLIQSIKVTDTGRIYTGKVGDTGITFKGIEAKKLGLIETTTPGITIRAGGLRTDFTTITTNQVYRNLPGTSFSFGSTPGSVGQTIVYGTTQTVFTGGKFKSFSQDFTRPTYQASQATFIKPANQNVNYFVASPAKPIYQYTSGKGSFSYTPSGKYQVSAPTVIGREINLANLFRGTKAGGGNVGTSFTGGGTKTPFSVTFQQQTPVFQFNTPRADISSTVTTTSTVVPSFLPSSQRQETELTQRTVQVPKIGSTTKQSTQTSRSLINPALISSTPKSTSRTNQNIIQAPKLGITPRQEERTETIVAPILNTPQSPRVINTPTGSFKPTTPIPFILPKFLGADASGGLGKIKASRTYRYTPSFGALALKGQKFRVGTTSTKRFTGLEYRGAKQSNTKLLKSFKLPTDKRKKKKK